MSKKTPFWICCIAVALTSTSISAESFPLHHLGQSVIGPTCDIPAPNNFQVVETGTTYTKLQWDYVPNAVGGYRIRLFKTSDGTLLATQYKGQDQLNTVVDQLPNDTEITAIINTRCDNADSPQEVSASLHTLILELVVIGFTPTSAAAVCALPTNHFCSFNPQGQDFRIIGPNMKPQYFKMSTNLGSTLFRCRLNSNNPNDGFYFVCSDPAGSTPCFTNSIKVWGLINNVMIPVAEFSANGTAVGPNLYGTYFYPGVSIEKLDGGYFNGPAAGKASDQGSSSDSNSISVSPNPFSNTLDIHSNNPQDAIQVRLFDVNGKKILEQRFYNTGEDYSISTSDIPSGLYFLKIQSGDQIQTLKVVKSE